MSNLDEQLTRTFCTPAGADISSGPKGDIIRLRIDFDDVGGRFSALRLPVRHEKLSVCQCVDCDLDP